jgi:hypothetical protein
MEPVALPLRLVPSWVIVALVLPVLTIATSLTLPIVVPPRVVSPVVVSPGVVSPGVSAAVGSASTVRPVVIPTWLVVPRIDQWGSVRDHILYRHEFGILVSIAIAEGSIAVGQKFLLLCGKRNYGLGL